MIGEFYMTKIYGSLVIKNEKGRYLESCINWHSQFLDEIFVYDDQSDDGSIELAKDLGCTVIVRDASTPSFMEHEGHFRWKAWQEMESALSLKKGDWIFSFDADEFLVTSTNLDMRETLDKTVDESKRNNRLASVIHRPEIFKIDRTYPVDESGIIEDCYIRVDGEWNNIFCSRLFAYLPNAKWNLIPMGCGSEPKYLFDNWRGGRDKMFGKPVKELALLHYGYARAEDVKDKYDRYNNLPNNGHNNNHIQSIIENPVLKKWIGNKPNIGLDA